MPTQVFAVGLTVNVGVTPALMEYVTELLPGELQPSVVPPTQYVTVVGVVVLAMPEPGAPTGLKVAPVAIGLAAN